MVWDSAATGFVFLVIAQVVKNHHPSLSKINWEWVHAAFLLLAGIGLMKIIGTVLAWTVHMTTWLINQVVGSLHGLPSWIGMALGALPAALPWCLGAALVITLIFHMWPRHGGVRGSTPWIAFFAPAAIAFFPPLLSLTGVGG
ncbi:MAG: hypothetical protein ACREQ5_05850 [Candidatus Dormibacteria bacterium]